MVVGRKAAGAWLVVCAAWLGGCGDGLGECDPAALGGNMTPGMLAPYEGQQILATRCASCHSANAVGAQRRGAPADLNFDVLALSGSDADRAKLAKALGVVVDWSEEIWNEIDGETMPPEKPAGSGPLSSAEKEAVRNWLACGADGIGADTNASATWESIWSGITATNCLGCHDSMTAGISMGAVLGNAGDACGSYNLIVGQTGIAAGMCAGVPLVTPFQPQNSHLLLKIKADPTACGGPMPAGSPMGLTQANPQLIQQIETWIMAGAMPPAGCP